MNTSIQANKSSNQNRECSSYFMEDFPTPFGTDELADQTDRRSDSNTERHTTNYLQHHSNNYQ